MTAVSVTSILVAPEGFSLSSGFAVPAAAAAAVAALLAFLWTARKKDHRTPVGPEPMAPCVMGVVPPKTGPVIVPGEKKGSQSIREIVQSGRTGTPSTARMSLLSKITQMATGRAPWARR